MQKKLSSIRSINFDKKDKPLSARPTAENVHDILKKSPTNISIYIYAADFDQKSVLNQLLYLSNLATK